jgi:cation diffusion facilitator CzcD-associated flavoprotein CzcO
MVPAQGLPDLDTRMVKSIAPATKGFRLVLAAGDTVDAKRVVIATGLTNQAYRPAPFEGLSPALVSHASEVTSPQDFRGRHVAVVGRGQSACESAVLLHEAGAEVDLICRGDVHWIGSEAPGATRGDDLPWSVRKIMAGPSAVGPFPFNWLVDTPGLLRRLPPEWRNWVSARSLRPAATAWLRSRAEGMRIRAGRTILGASDQAGRIALQLDNGVSAYDHAFLGTGYRVDLAKLAIIAPELLRRVRHDGGFPVLSAGFETSVPGLHVVGSPAVGSFGPLPRFVAGCGYAARSLTRAALADATASFGRRLPRPVMQPQG